MVAFVQTQESIWLLPRNTGGLQKLLQTYGLCICCEMPPKALWWLPPFISSAVPLPRSHPGTSKSSRRSFRIIIDVLGPSATLLLCTWASCSSSSHCLPPRSSGTGGGSQLCPCFALLSNRSCLSKNLMQEYNSFISRMLRLEGTLKTISSQSPAMSRDTSHYIRLLKALYNMAWKHCQVWGIHNIPGQPLSVSHHPDSKEFLPNT